MTHKAAIAALGAIMATAAAANVQPAEPTAPPGMPDTRYCLKVEPQTGSRIESVECWTREEWAAADVNVDKEWPKEGVRVIEG